ncbi:MAG: hypothetical protein ACO1OB_08760 [Archangium sp.]
MSLQLPRDLLIREFISEYAGVRFNVSGNCMVPHFRHGDTVEVRSVRLGAPQPGDVVLVDVNGALKLHRLEAVGRVMVRTVTETGRVDPLMPRGNVLAVLERVNGLPFYRRGIFERLHVRAARVVRRVVR